MVTLAPLPSWLDVLGAVIHPAPADQILAAPWCRDDEVAGWLSRSAWSLALIALWRQRRGNGSTVNVWIPDFFCDSSLAALRMTGARLTFYPLTAQMAPDLVACRALIDAAVPDLFLLVHYFGQPAPTAGAREFCARHDAWLIEDAAHVLRPVSGIGDHGDFVLYSPHKHFPIPAGAVLVIRPEGPGRFGTDEISAFGPPDSWPGQLGELHRKLGTSSNDARVALWLLKRLAQKVGVRSWHRTFTTFQEPSTPGLADVASLGSPAQSRLAQRLLARALSDIGEVERRRQRHQLLWDDLLLGNGSSRSPAAVFVAERPMNREWTPYLAPYQADASAAGTIFQDWQRRNLPVTTWPDLPPEVAARRDQHEDAWNRRHSRLYLPVHQSLSPRSLLSFRLAPRSREAGRVGIKPDWNGTTQIEWRRLMDQIDHTNLLQTWAYGEAKSAHEGWQVKRCVFYRGADPVGLVQMLQKRVAGLLRIVRINRGPLFLSSARPEDRRAVFVELARTGRALKGAVLTLAPELELSAKTVTLMADLGFRQFTRRAWESTRIDLRQDLAQLRRQLDGKWRNMLTFAEKSHLQIEIGTGDPLFGWMIARYQELVEEKGFRGLSRDFLLQLRNHLSDEESFLVLRALHNGEPVAGICLARHGRAATYLMGWNGPAGRNLKANQLLLWEALSHLKQSGLHWFDLGGIDEEHTPGISAFKLGMNGHRYELVGEYWKW